MPEIIEECVIIDTGAGDWTQDSSGNPVWVPVRTSKDPCEGICGPEDLADWKVTADEWIQDLEEDFGGEYPLVNELRDEFNRINVPDGTFVFRPHVDRYVELAQRACSVVQEIGPAEGTDQCDPTQKPPYGYVCVNEFGRWTLVADPNAKPAPIPSRPPAIAEPAKKSSSSKEGQNALMLLMGVGVLFGIVAMNGKNKAR